MINQLLHFDVDRRDEFFRSRGWKFVESLGGDCSSRRYFRLRKGNEFAVLMESFPDNSSFAAQGHSIEDFTRIGSWLRSNDIHAPEIFEADPEAGFIIMEDFGDTTFRKALKERSNPGPVYTLATDLLIKLGALKTDIRLPDYHDSHIHEGRRRVIDWYVPVARKEKIPPGLAEEYLDIWEEIEACLPPYQKTFIHADYHPGNLMWLPLEEGLDCVGILDFQGAMLGPRPYDLVNLLEDARCNVPEDIKTAEMDRYCHNMASEEHEIFLQWYKLLAAQFHCRVAGQFIKLALTENKTEYLEHLPRLAEYLKEEMKDPLLAPLSRWFAEQNITFEKPLYIDIEQSRDYIAEDAF